MSTSDPAAPAGARRPIDPAHVAGALADPTRWDVRHVMATGSTNDDLSRGGGRPVGEAAPVLVTEEQTAGRGRSGRQWACPPGAGLMFSVRLALPEVPVDRRGWIGAVLGLAICRAFREIGFTATTLKWPNDVLVDGGKCGGILAEMTTDGVVVGAGLNISLTTQELPRADATSLLLAAGGPAGLPGSVVVDRDVLLAAILDDFSSLLQDWRAAGGDVDESGLRRRYLDSCATVGSSVRIELPGGACVIGVAVDVDATGAIVLQGEGGIRLRYAAGDVVHLRPAELGVTR